MTRNEQYWIDRANRRMDSYTLSAIAQARIINQSYNQMCNYVQSEIAKILRHVGDEGTLAYEYRMKRLTALLERTNKRMQELYGVTLNDTTEFLRSIIPEAYYHTIFDIAQGTGYQPMFSAVNNRLIDKIINENWSGQNYSKRIWRNTDALTEKIRGVLTEAAMSGESIYKTSRKLSEAFAVSEYVSKRLIQTETTYACGQAELASYNELDIAEYKYVATLDERTCPICGGHDGEIYLVKDAKPGVNYKPMHPHCHCDMLAYFGEEYEPKERAARDENGNRIRVPADMTYKDWYKKYIESDAQSAPAPARGNNTPKPSGKPQQLPVKPSAGNAVEVPVSEPVNPSGAYTDTPIPPKINNQSIDNSVQNDIIKSIDVDDYDLVTYGKGIAPEVNTIILNTMRKREKDGGFIISEVSTKVTTLPDTKGTPILQIEPMSNGLLRLNINADYLSGRTLDEVNQAIMNTEINVAKSLEEAVVHESGHAISIKGKTPSEISAFYSNLKGMGMAGISQIALEDGAECLAELEVLRYRKEKVSKELSDFYEKYMGRKYL